MFSTESWVFQFSLVTVLCFAGTPSTSPLRFAITQVDAHMDAVQAQGAAKGAGWTALVQGGSRGGNTRRGRRDAGRAGADTLAASARSAREGRPTARGSRERHGDGFHVTRGLALDGGP